MPGTSFRNPRGTEGLMDFSYDNPPTDPNSPWPQHRQPSVLNQSSFNSQPTNSFATPSTPAPAFRNPAFAALSTEPSPFRKASFTTPQKPFDHQDHLFSEASGAESSPADNADAEDTPELQHTLRNMTVTKPKQPLFGHYGSDFKGPSRASHFRGNKYTISQSSKARKRKRQATGKELVGPRSDYECDSDSSESSNTQPKRRNQHEDYPYPPRQNWFAAFLSGIESRPNLPNILSYYAQLTLNSFIVFIILYAVYTFWTTVQSDVSKETEKARAAVMEEMAKCAYDYAQNKCGADNRLPALESVCRNWEVCMNRDPMGVGKARVGASTWAHILNSFIEPISYKAMIFVLLVLTSSILVNNLAFSVFRNPTSPANMIPSIPSLFSHPSHPSQPATWPPQTPTHRGSYDAYAVGGNIGTSFHGNLPALPPPTPSTQQQRRSLSKGRGEWERERSRSPSKGKGFY